MGTFSPRENIPGYVLSWSKTYPRYVFSWVRLPSYTVPYHKSISTHCVCLPRPWRTVLQSIVCFRPPFRFLYFHIQHMRCFNLEKKTLKKWIFQKTFTEVDFSVSRSRCFSRTIFKNRVTCSKIKFFFSYTILLDIFISKCPKFKFQTFFTLYRDPPGHVLLWIGYSTNNNDSSNYKNRQHRRLSKNDFEERSPPLFFRSKQIIG